MCGMIDVMSSFHDVARTAGLAVAAALAAWSCSAQGPAMSDLPAPVTPPAQRTLDDTVLLARRMASTATGHPPLVFQVVSAEAVTWADGSIGCPQPGMLYPQALVPGYRVELRAPDGKLLTFHASRRGTLVQCPEGRAQRPAPTGADH